MASEVFDMKKYNKFKKLYKSGGNMKKSGLNLKVKEITLSSTGREGTIYKGKAKDYPGIVKIIKKSTN